MEQKSHVAQVADELVKLGFTADEADLLAREKHRAHSDLVKTAGRSPGEIAEEIAQRETEPAVGVGPEGSSDGADEIAEVAAENSASLETAIEARDELEAFERTIPGGR